jgi:hypothetical protein
MFRRTLIDRLLAQAAGIHARRVLRGFMEATAEATAVQQRVLLQHVARNADSAYGRTHGFGQIRNYDDFRRQVPIRTYDDMAPWIQRVLRGEAQALFGRGQKILMFALTSGTSSEPKYIPVTQRFLDDVRAGWNAFGVKALLDHPGNVLQPILQISSRMDERRTETGVPCGAITGLMAATQKHLVRKYYIAPPCVAEVEDALSRYYTIMRLAVAQPRVGFAITANPATQLRLARTAADHAGPLIRDIHDGTLWRELDVAPAVRRALQPRLRARPARARELERIAARHGALLPRDYWGLGYLCNWTGGTLGLFLRDFKSVFGDTPVRDIGLIASEGRMSIPVQDGTPAGILEVRGTFYEFVPAEQIDDPRPDCLRSHEVKTGEEYFILLTNAARLYRYNIGDRVRVVGFEGQAPLIEFLSKGANSCSLTGEKLTEHQVTQAASGACRACGVTLQGYVLAPRFADPPFYVLHVEGDGQPVRDGQTGLAGAMDRALADVNIEYAAKRRSLRLGAVQLNILPAGFLEARHRQLASRHRRANEQYKHQFLLTAVGTDGDFPALPDMTRPAAEAAANVRRAAPS